VTGYTRTLDSYQSDRL